MAESSRRALRAGIEYPSNLASFGRFLPDEEGCQVCIQHLRWPNGFTCRACGKNGDHPWHAENNQATEKAFSSPEKSFLARGQDAE